MTSYYREFFCIPKGPKAQSNKTVIKLMIFISIIVEYWKMKPLKVRVKPKVLSAYTNNEINSKKIMKPMRGFQLLLGGNI